MDCGFVKMSRTNFFAILDSDDESRDGVDTRKKELTARAGVKNRVRGGQTAALLEEDATRPWGDIALERDGIFGKRTYPDAIGPTKEFTCTDLYFAMCEEPWKYGADLEVLRKEVADEPEVIEIAKTAFVPIAKECAKVAAKRWVARDIRRHVLKFNTLATKIQALVRGYQTRCKNPHLDCCMCLRHVQSPLKTAVGFMCRECGEAGPYVDIVEEDPWNWHRTDYVDEAHSGRHLYIPCNYCNQDFPKPLWNGIFCSYECEYADNHS